MIFLSETKHVRLTKEVADHIKYLMDHYPEEYRTISDVLRAGPIALRRWKDKYEKEQEAIQ